MKKYDKMLNVLIVVGSLFMFIGYISYFVKLLIWSEGRLPFTVAVTVCLLLPLVLILGKKGMWQKTFGKVFPAIKTLYALGLCFYVVSFLYMCGYIYGNTSTKTDVSALPENTVFVTLGAKVEYTGNPGKVLKKRLETTYNLLTSCPNAICVASGGQGSDEPISEAQCMYNYLTSRGIDGERIILENKSTNTIENIRNTVALLENKGITDYHLAYITTNFHVPRTKFLCKKLGVPDANFFGSPDTAPLMLYTILVREYMSYCKLFIFGT